MILDKCGRELQRNDIVDACMMGMFSGRVVEVVERSIVVPGRPATPPHLVVQFVIPFETGEVSRDGERVRYCDRLYVVGKVEEQPGVGAPSNVVVMPGRN